MKNAFKKMLPYLALITMLAAMAFGTVSVSAAVATQDYAKLNYAKNVQVPICDHVWRMPISNLCKATDATVTSSDTSVAEVTIYRAMIKQGCIYITPKEAGKTTVTVTFTFRKSNGRTVTSTVRTNLTVYPYTNPLSLAQIGPNKLASKVTKSNNTNAAKLCSGKAKIRMVPRSGWTVRAVYAQGLMRVDGKVLYKTVKIPNKKVYNFGKFTMVPDIYVECYNSAKKRTVTVRFGQGLSSRFFRYMV